MLSTQIASSNIQNNNSKERLRTDLSNFCSQKISFDAEYRRKKRIFNFNSSTEDLRFLKLGKAGHNDIKS